MRSCVRRWLGAALSVLLAANNSAASTDADSAATTTVRSSTLSAGGGLAIDAGRDINLQAAEASAGGNVQLAAVRDANMLAALDGSNYAHLHEELFAGVSLDVSSSLIGAGKALADAAQGLAGGNAAQAVAPTALAALKAGGALAAAGNGLGTASQELDKLEAGTSPLASVSLSVGFKAGKTSETAAASRPAVTTILSGGATTIVAQVGSITGHGVQIAAGGTEAGPPAGRSPPPVRRRAACCSRRAGTSR